jgi:hypothetical protein
MAPDASIVSDVCPSGHFIASRYLFQNDVDRLERTLGVLRNDPRFLLGTSLHFLPRISVILGSLETHKPAESKHGHDTK